ncbi:hypothetical protein PTE31013_04331 [Pandoraea terrigena]|uniref:Uncharacterized protein n=2 Tax=Pandoraea terrigena TaxID=2508292 RepID=A0A5E4Y5V7_9BURK|nr:hypothetical protein PTE31013_04331 [Pandoraea terrigena]
MTLRSGNPQALMLPNECLHHYHVAPHADDADDAVHAERPGAQARLGRWLLALVRRNDPTRHAG